MTHNRTRVTHAKELFYICCILMVLLIGLLSIVGPAGYLEMRKVQAELAAQTARVDALRKSIEHQTNVVNALRDDEKTIEEYARKKGYGKKGRSSRRSRRASRRLLPHQNHALQLQTPAPRPGANRPEQLHPAAW